MPWENLDNSQPNAHNAGFSEVKPWLPVDQQHKLQAVAEQENDANSILNAYREFMAWRKNQSVLLEGDIEFLQTAEPILAFYRTLNEEKMLCVFNLSGTKAELVIDVSVEKEHSALSHYNALLNNKTLTVEPFGSYYANCS